jgi:hypothetical protein
LYGLSESAAEFFPCSPSYGTLNEGTISRLLHMAKLETAIRTWRDTLTENKRENWNSPTLICNRCPAVGKAIAEAKKNKPPRPP